MESLSFFFFWLLGEPNYLIIGRRRGVFFLLEKTDFLEADERSKYCHSDVPFSAALLTYNLYYKEEDTSSNLLQ
jgi:hypothetical protein